MSLQQALSVLLLNGTFCGWYGLILIGLLTPASTLYTGYCLSTKGPAVTDTDSVQAAPPGQPVF